MLHSLAARHAGRQAAAHLAGGPGGLVPIVTQRLGSMAVQHPLPPPLGLCAVPLRERRLHTAQGLWLNVEQQPDGVQAHVEAGREARAGLRRETPALQGRHSAQRAALADQVQRAVYLQPHLQTALLASSMLAGLESSEPEILQREAPGIVHGLRLLELAPGDAVAECDPGDLALPVHLALRGCPVTVLHADMLTSARLWDEVEAYARGTPRGMPRQQPDGQPWLAPSEYRARAMDAGKRLCIQPLRDWSQLPRGDGWRALISRGRLAFREPEEATQEICQAARLLLPGGGLLFRLAHGAGEGEGANAGWTRRQFQLGALEDVARSHGLNLRCAHITFDSPGVESGTLLAPRQVAPECNGWVSFHNVDAAAWEAWNALQKDTWVKHHPMTVEVSGMLERGR